MWRVMQPETEDQALYADIFLDTFGLVFKGALVESVVFVYLTDLTQNRPVVAKGETVHTSDVCFGV